MKNNDEIALQVAKLLLQIKAVKLNVENPFQWASGWKSPIYCDNRISLSYPKIRTYIRQELAKLVEEKFGTPDTIAGVATAGIPQGVLVAEALGLPFIYVRSKPKKHGMKNNIEGFFEENQNVVVVEDLISTGGSSLKAVQDLKDAGLKIKGVVSIFTYGFPMAENNFNQAGIQFFSLSNYDALLEEAISGNLIHENQLSILKNWKEDPENWKNIISGKLF